MNNIPVKGIVGATVAVLFGTTVLFGSWYTVDQGARGVILRNGAISGVADPGLGFKLPLFDDVVDISVQEHSRVYGEETGLASYSKDQQPAQIRVSVNYRIPEGRVKEVYAEFGGEDGLVSRILDPRVQQSVKNVFGGFAAVTAIQERARLNLAMLEALQVSIGDAPLIVNGLQVENIDFSEAYEQSVEQRMLAEVEVAKLRQNAEREKVQAEITVTQAKARADAVRAEAEAAATATKLRGEAEAVAIAARGKALADNPSVIGLVHAEKWDGKLPVTMLPGASVPFINVH